jgi:hypothetical protein
MAKQARARRTSSKAAGTIRRKVVGKTLKPIGRLAAVRGAERRDVPGVRLEIGRAGDARVKRTVYPPGFHWAVDLQPIVGTALCEHAHAGLLTQGEFHIRYADGCVVKYKAPQIIAIEPGHDGWVVGTEPVVMIEFDFERDTVRRLGMRKGHRHN